MRIALWEPPRYSNNALLSMVNLPNDGLLSVATTLKLQGHDVRLFDAKLEDMQWAEIALELNSGAFDLVGASAYTLDAYTCFIIFQLAKQANPACFTLLGGYHGTFLARLCLMTCQDLDCVVVGEGEDTARAVAGIDLRGCQERDSALSSIPGLAFRDSTGVIRFTQPSGFIQNLDELPMPAYELSPIERYHFPILQRGIQHQVGIGLSTSRGCPSRCDYCSNSGMWNATIRWKSARRALAEMEILYRVHGKRHFFFYDNDFFLNKERLLQFVEGLESSDMDASWSCEVSPRTILRCQSILPRLRKSGLDLVFVGFEFASDRVLGMMGKRAQSVTDSIAAARLLREAGILCVGLGIIGTPDFTTGDVEEYLEFFGKQLRCDLTYTQLLTPLPGSALYSRYDSEKIIADYNFSHYDLYTPVLRYENMAPEDLVRARDRINEALFSPLCVDMYSQYRQNQLSFEILMGRYYVLRDAYSEYANGGINFTKFREMYLSLLGEEIPADRIEQWKQMGAAAAMKLGSELGAEEREGAEAVLSRRLREFEREQRILVGDTVKEVDENFQTILRTMVNGLDKSTAKRLSEGSSRADLIDVFMEGLCDDRKRKEIVRKIEGRKEWMEGCDFFFERQEAVRTHEDDQGSG